ncbi:MAG: hypothetical protein GF344_06145 [Chitinivibrionales bacterium]|nr:hypothetical protein [Chitinivibrionales bacterium]
MRIRNGLTEVVVTDSIPQIDGFRDLPYYRICGLADGLCRTINRIHCSAPVSEVFEEDDM